jgi:MoxR-like ATPase
MEASTTAVKNSESDRIKYFPSEELVIAAEVAMELGQPLLLSGAPGTGKTRFARYLAETLAPRWFKKLNPETEERPLPLYSFETKSATVATDLFYRFDNLRRFHASHDSSMSQQNRDYISFEALGKAILFSNPWKDVYDLVPVREHHPGAGRAVVLIDEIDKAPRDFPNDILNEIEGLFFRIPEVQMRDEQTIRSVKADPAFRPLVVLTSNSEKDLPHAFLRRCIFHHINFYKREQAALLQKIIAANLVHAEGKLADDALEFFFDVRELNDLNKLPTTAELVQWLRVLQAREWSVGRLDPAQDTLAKLPLVELQASLSILAKTDYDIGRLHELAAQRISQRRGK